MELLVDIQVTSRNTCEEFGQYEPLFTWNWQGTKAYCLADVGSMDTISITNCQVPQMPLKPVEVTSFFNKTICGKRQTKFKDWAVMLRNSREEFYTICSNGGMCPITEIWFQLSPESSDEQATVVEYAQGNYIGFKRSTLESSRFDDFIKDAFIASGQDCHSKSESLQILDDTQCDDRRLGRMKQILPLAKTELDLLRLSGTLKEIEKLPMQWQEVEQYKKEIDQYELSMFTEAFPSFKPLCDKGDIVQKLDENFFFFDSFKALERRSWNKGYEISINSRRNYVVGPVVLGGLIFFVNLIVLLGRSYANPPHNEQKMKYFWNVFMWNSLLMLPMIALWIVNLIHSLEERSKDTKLTFFSIPLENFVEQFRTPLEECFDSEAVSFDSESALESWSKQPSQTLPVTMILLYSAILGLEIIVIVFLFLHLSSTSDHLIAKQRL